MPPGSWEAKKLRIHLSAVTRETPIMRGRERRSHSAKAGVAEVEDGMVAEALAGGSEGVEGGGAEDDAGEDPDGEGVDAEAAGEEDGAEDDAEVVDEGGEGLVEEDLVDEEEPMTPPMKKKNCAGRRRRVSEVARAALSGVKPGNFQWT